MNNFNFRNKRKIYNDNNEKSSSNKKLKMDENLSEPENTNIDISDFGEMNYVCKFCSAVYWPEEQMTSNCCNKGKIFLSPLSEYNHELKYLLLNDKDFRIMIRYYNSLFAFATFSANVKHLKQRGVYNLKIQGQVCHITPITLVPKNNEPSCGQLYIYDDNIAVEKRLKTHQNLIKSHLEILTNIMNKNPYAKNYKCLHELSYLQKLPNYKLYFMRKNSKHQHCYNKPLTSECAAIIVSKSGVLDNYDVCIYPKNDDVEGGKGIHI